MEFTELNLHPDLAKGVAEAGYATCMPVQEQVLTHAFGGQDLYVQSQTGTGKTAAFLIVIFERLLTEPNLAGKKALIIAPTRELAVQIEEEAEMLAKYLPFKVGSFYGGVGYTDQQRLLRNNVQILVGTPGRVLDLNSSGQMNLMDLAFLVLDEADRMFDMGFYPDLRKLIKAVPPVDRRQTMLFSATLNAWVKNLAWEYTKTPYEIEIEPETVTVDEIEQYLVHVPSADKMKVLLGILRRDQPESAIIFCNTKRYAEIVAKRLRVNGFECEFIMGDLPQSKRLKIIEDLKAGELRFLVATDVAARGLDIEGLAMVINYDLPVESENYVHRIGRTARAGKTGKAFTLASEQDVYELPAIERYIGKKIPSETATEALFAEDKSEGMRIRTEFVIGRDGGRGGGGRDDRRDRNGSFGRGRGEGRHGERHGGRAGGKAESGRPGHTGGRGHPGDNKPGHDSGRTGSPANGRDRGRKSGRLPGEDSSLQMAGRQGDGRPNGEDLSRLSFDERMIRYKEKYAGGDPAGGPAGGKADDRVTAGTAKGGGAAVDAASGGNGPRQDQGQGPRKWNRRGRGGEGRRDEPRETASQQGQNPQQGSGQCQRQGERKQQGRRQDGQQGEKRRDRGLDRAASDGKSGGPRQNTQPGKGGPRNEPQGGARGSAQGTTAPKKGLVGRILGLFGKKPKA
jgi:ATP-dependent RNA helicase RhlB